MELDRKNAATITTIPKIPIAGSIVKENGVSLLQSSITVGDALSVAISPDAASSTTSASGTPTPPDAILDKTWAATYDNIGACEEQRQLLGTEEESSDRHSSDGDCDEGGEDEAITGGGETNAADDDDVWQISPEQHHYYETQFKQLQSQTNGNLISGFDARSYFEKSKLPLQELRKIWQLSDVTLDGALSLAEFKVAMHLVVLRRNDIRLPETLPQSLADMVFQQDVVAIANTVAPTDGTNTARSATITATTTSVSHSGNSTAQGLIPSPCLSNSESLSSPQLKGKEWTKFVDSPTSTLSSPGLKPVNFDFLRPSVEQNPKILHPVAVRATPGIENVVVEDFKKVVVPPPPPPPPSSSSSSSCTSSTFTNESFTAVDSATNVLKSIQRPQPKKYAVVAGPGVLPPPPTALADDLGCTGSISGPTSLPVLAAATVLKKEPPPPPPPRPSKTHYRSSSLDLNKLGKGTAITTVPSIPPRTSPNSATTVATNTTITSTSTNNTLKNLPSSEGYSNDSSYSHLTDITRSCYHGAFHVYKRTTDAKLNFEPPSTEKKISVPEICVDEKNRYLRKVCQELQEELNVLRQERVALQLKLEKLHSRSPIHSPA